MACAVLGLVLSSAQVIYDYLKERDRIRSTVSEIASMLREQAVSAAYNVNRSAAATVINGLFEYQPIREAKLVDDFGATLAYRQRPQATGWMDSLVKVIFGADMHYTTPLFQLDGKTSLGQVEIVLDSYLIGLDFFRRSAASILGIVCLTVLLATVLAFMTYYSITKPLLAVGRGLASVDPANPAGSHLRRLRGREQDELGLLVNSVNRLLDGLDDSLNRYRTLVETMNEGLMICDASGRLNYVNEKLCSILGFSKDAMLGRPVSDFMGEGDRRAFQEIVSPQGVLNERPCEIQWVHRNGSLVASILSPRARFDKSGVYIGAFAVVTDITDRKRMEQALRDSEAKFKSSFEHAASGMALVNVDGSFLQVNHALGDMLGRTQDELLKKNWMDMADPAELANFQAMPPPNAGLGDGLQAEKRYIHKDGHAIWVIESCSLLRDENGSPVYYICQYQDITAMRLAEQDKEKLRAQLLQAQKMESVGKLAGGVAHDFNNMLGIILGNTELALLDVEPAHPVQLKLREIRSAAKRSADLTRQLLAFARKQNISPRTLDLNETVECMLKMLRRLIGEDIDFAWLPGEDLWPVNVDPAQIDQVLANLCVNARDAIAGAGKITIETRKVVFDEAYCADHAGFIPGDFVMLAVSDDGCGMDRETLAKVFEPFFTTKELGKGTGLGLATVYGIVKQNNGFVNVYSEPGHGTTFKVYLPRCEGECQAREKHRDDAAKGPAGRGETVLLVEDEAALLSMTAKMLQRQGYDVLCASTPEAAIRLAKEHKDNIRLLITDVVMPGRNGRELQQDILLLHPKIKTLFMSGYTANVIAHHGVLDEGISFLQKPFSVKAIADKVREVLDG